MESLSRSPLVSVIVPVYRTEKYLNRCVASLIGQAEKNIEIILVEDGSPDNCPVICDKWAKRDGRIRVVHQKNCGLSTARNVGIGLARAPYIMFCDSDDEVLPDFCRVPVEQMRLHDADIVVFDSDRTDEDGSILSRQPFRMSAEGIMDREEALCHLAADDIYEFAWNKCYRRELFEGVRFPDGEKWEDMLTAYPLFAAAERIVVIRDVLYLYRQRPGSLIRENPSSAADVIVERRDAICHYLHEVCPAAEESMQLKAAKAELQFLRVKWKEKEKRVRYCAVRDRMLARPVKASHFNFLDRVSYMLAPLPPYLFGIINSVLVHLRSWKNSVRDWVDFKDER